MTLTIETCIQGHPMDLSLEISVLRAHFFWVGAGAHNHGLLVGDVEEIIVLGKKVLLGKR